MKRTAATLISLALLGVVPASAQVNFEQYVALGDSLTAGYASGGLTQFYQERSYPAMLAMQAGAPDFQQPIVSDPGLPPLLELVTLFPLTLEAPDVAPGVPLNAELPRPYNNLGVPGANTFDMLFTTGDITNLLAGNTDNVMHDLILRFPQVPDPNTGEILDATAIVQAIGLDPTFMTVWIGNNDHLTASLAGTPIDGVTMTPVSLFESLYTQAIGTLVATTDADIVLLNLPDATSIPFVTTVDPFIEIPGTGTIPLQSDNGPVSPDSLVTLAASELLALGYGLPGGPPLPDDLSIVDGSVVPGVILRPDEIATIRERVGAFNDIISDVADTYGLPVLDVNRIFSEIAGGNLWIIGGVELSADFLIGGIFSYDGVHPQNIGYALVAVELIDLINDFYGTSIPQVNLDQVLCTGGCSGQGPPTVIPSAEDFVFSKSATDRLLEIFPPQLPEAQRRTPTTTRRRAATTH
jgi:lysophospholipase L1-like esterase